MRFVPATQGRSVLVGHPNSLMGAGQLLRKLAATGWEVSGIGSLGGNGRDRRLFATTREHLMVFNRDSVEWSPMLSDLTVISAAKGPLLGKVVLRDEQRGMTKTFKGMGIANCGPIEAHLRLAVTAACLSGSTNSYVMTVAGNRGTNLALGDRVRVFIGRDSVAIESMTDPMKKVGASSGSLLEFVPGGAGLVSEGGGFIGGGFGFRGALAGMSIADVLNAATSKSHMETFLRIASTDWTLVLQSDAVSPEHLRANAPVITPVVAALPPSPSLSNELLNLADLHAKGLLTDDEFAAAKARLLA